ncbi:MAG TPA: type II toxin-antitoxin system VapC family toxin [Thermoanaerobaculia bacterium]|jgi:tRNA(fMet)-specific endonuclease VapC|nr:type II toxin-antitoxin system VapC family toxin [Thermoanaerobaculia bacterium]
MTRSGVEFSGRLVLDTSAYSHFRAGDIRVIDLIAVAEIVFFSTIVLGELESGFALGKRERENFTLLSEFLAEPFVAILPVTPMVARRYGLLFADLRRAGTPIPTNDIWIAATTLDCGGHLLSFDGDFKKVTSLDCTVLKPSME